MVPRAQAWQGDRCPATTQEGFRLSATVLVASPVDSPMEDADGEAVLRELAQLTLRFLEPRLDRLRPDDPCREVVLDLVRRYRALIAGAGPR